MGVKKQPVGNIKLLSLSIIIHLHFESALYAGNGHQNREEENARIELLPSLHSINF